MWCRRFYNESPPRCPIVDQCCNETSNCRDRDDTRHSELRDRDETRHRYLTKNFETETRRDFQNFETETRRDISICRYTRPRPRHYIKIFGNSKNYDLWNYDLWLMSSIKKLLSVFLVRTNNAYCFFVLNIRKTYLDNLGSLIFSRPRSRSRLYKSRDRHRDETLGQSRPIRDET